MTLETPRACLYIWGRRLTATAAAATRYRDQQSQRKKQEAQACAVPSPSHESDGEQSHAHDPFGRQEGLPSPRTESGSGRLGRDGERNSRRARFARCRDSRGSKGPGGLGGKACAGQADRAFEAARSGDCNGRSTCSSGGDPLLAIEAKKPGVIVKETGVVLVLGLKP